MQRIVISLDVDLTDDEAEDLTWSAQLRDSENAEVGAAITTGFSQNIGVNGIDYIWDYSLVPDDFTSGHVTFTPSKPEIPVQEASIIPSILASVTINYGVGYHAYQDSVDQRGEENIRSWSNKGGSGDVDLNAFNRSIRDARTTINGKLHKRFVFPLIAMSGDAISQDTIDKLNKISESFGAFYLYAARGLDIENDSTANLLKLEYDSTMAELNQLTSGEVFIDLRTLSEFQNPRSAVVVTVPIGGYCVR